MSNQLGRAKKGRGKSQNTNKHRKSFPVIVDSLIQNADIILEILDARFIEKTRNIEMEEDVRKQEKVLIYILNKSDLVDINKVLREVELNNLKPNLFFSSKDRKGSTLLRKMIKIEAKKINKEVVNVGIVGYPNTGKSSLINYLAGKHSARVSPESGHTKGIQKIKISQGIYLIDTPGVIPPKEKILTTSKSKHSQIGAISWDKAKDPDMIVFKLMEEYPGVFEKYYQIKADGNSELLIEELGRKLNYLQKGNTIDEIRTSKQILKDWQEGKIRIY